MALDVSNVEWNIMIRDTIRFGKKMKSPLDKGTFHFERFETEVYLELDEIKRSLRWPSQRRSR